MELVLSKLKTIKAFIFDVDGVLTDGNVLTTEKGEMLRTFNIKDGYALQHALKLKYPVGIISGGKTEGVRLRLEFLGIKNIYLGQKNKKDAFQNFLNTHKLNAEDILYMGDDIPDLELIKMSGLGCCPKDAVVDILQVADFISPYEGGKGCVRDIIEKTLKAQQTWWNEESYSW